jgi:hypothetical protein
MLKLEIDHAAVKSLSNSREIIAALVAQAEAIAEEAKRTARAEYFRTGAYAEGIRARPVRIAYGMVANQIVGQVQATDFKSYWAEFGWTENGQHHPPKAIVRRAAEALGLAPIPMPKP